MGNDHIIRKYNEIMINNANITPCFKIMNDFVRRGGSSRN